MTRQDVTFFGEVGAVSSRALWSDSEDDDDLVEEVKKWTVSVAEGFSIDKFDVVFVSRSLVQNDQRLERISGVDVQEDGNTKQLKLMELYGFQNDSKSGWIVVNQSTMDKMADGCVDVLRQVFQKCLQKTNAVLMIVMAAAEVGNEIKCLQNEYIRANHPLFMALKNVIPKKVLPPTIISNPLEAVTFELCTIMTIGSCIFLAPDSNRCNFDVDTINLPDMMKIVIKSLNTGSRALSDSNIYT